MSVRIGKRPTRRCHFIREWREYRGIPSQAELAKRIGASVATISRIESGAQNYTQATLELIAEALRTDPADLLSRNPMTTDQLDEVLEQASPSQRRIIVEVAKGVIKSGR
jgi:transcriptional regulator with XRE-family HTH domain